MGTKKKHMRKNFFQRKPIVALYVYKEGPTSEVY